MILEKEIEAKLVKIVAKHGGRCLKWVCPGWTGVPDRIILLPGGRIRFAEIKRPEGGRYSPTQNWWGRRLTALGFIYWRIKDAEDLAEVERNLAEKSSP